jgi:hypothetical protein
MEEVSEFIHNPVRNVRKALAVLRRKFDGIIAGPVDSADDRMAGQSPLLLRPCRYAPADSRCMAFRVRCALGSIVFHPGDYGDRFRNTELAFLLPRGGEEAIPGPSGLRRRQMTVPARGDPG